MGSWKDADEPPKAFFSTRAGTPPNEKALKFARPFLQGQVAATNAAICKAVYPTWKSSMATKVVHLAWPYMVFSMQDAARHASICTALRAAMITRGMKWRVINLHVDASQENGTRVMEDVHVVGIRSLTITGVRADLVEIFNHVAALTRPELWHVRKVVLSEEENADEISEDIEAAFVRALETLISAVARGSLHLTHLQISVVIPLGRCTLQQLAVAVGWSNSLVSLELQSKFDTNQDIERGLKSLVDSGWGFGSHTGSLMRRVVRYLPPDIVELQHGVASALSQASQALQKRIAATRTNEDIGQVKAMLEECKRIADAFNNATRGAADDDDDELKELDEELAQLINDEPTVSTALQRIRTMYA